MRLRRPSGFVKMHPIVFYLLTADIFIISGFGLIDPIFAVFLTDSITGMTLTSVGVASSIFLVSKSVVQLPFARHVDTHNDANDLAWLLRATTVVMLVPLLYIVAENVYHIYFIQFLYGIGSGIAYATWLGLWSLHLDRGKESFEWSMHSTLTSIGTAIAATMGAVIAEAYGFNALFMTVSALSFCGVVLLLGLQRNARVYARHHHPGEL